MAIDMISQVGRYQITGELGQGAMGVVYKARDPLIDREVAIKTINLGLAQEDRDEYEARFYQEAKAAGRLSHPNIVTIFDVGRTEDTAYIAMEYLQGRELREILNDNKKLPLGQVIDVVAQVASGLAYAHEHHIVHRDIKPSNIMVDRDGHVKITDFGIARMASAGVLTQTGMVLGSPKYMSPEQVMGKVTDQRSDIFSLGVMLYEMLAGQVPFIGDNINAIMYQTLNAVPVSPSSINSAVPEMLNFIVAKALAKDLDSRYQNARDLANDLRACGASLQRTDAEVTGRPVVTKLDPLGVAPISLREAGEDEPESVQPIGLSSSFDSMEATMRLAAMTTSVEEVEELSKTLRINRPSIKEINQAATPERPAKRESPSPRAIVQQPAKKSSPSNGGGYILLGIIFLVVIGLISTVVF